MGAVTQRTLKQERMDALLLGLAVALTRGCKGCHGATMVEGRPCVVCTPLRQALNALTED